ncbi:hypothetical protein ABI_11700 [Asticcacaulis biprosthecium C19]|uniref:Lipoprotein n=1 Tax=Asticcacaulis biprosthecium C19 TaxID=715226 RepID=F4QHJ6_9CAUL|nr:hypothetical protein [Asticcacaulis biprosthecium]EGF92733.1 hypothetical protein ABI_11700 [Asticcacaulis biprosthecium C19]
MRRFLTVFTCAAALLAGPALAQDEAEIARMVAHPDFHVLPLDIGEDGKIRQTAKVTKSQTRAGKSQTVVLTSQATLDYRMEGEEFYVTRTLDTFDATSPDASASNLAESRDAVTNALGGIKSVRYVTDDSLRPTRIEDWPTFKTNIYALFDQLMGANPSPEIKAKSHQIADSLFGQLTAESAAGLFLSNETMLSIPRNIGLVLNEPLSADGQIAVPIGNTVLDARETLTLSQWNEAAGTAHVTYDYAPTPESLKAFVSDFLPRFLKSLDMPATARAEMDKQLAAGLSTSVMDMTTHCDFDVAIATGLVSAGTCVKTVAFQFGGESQKKVETFVFTETLAE